MQVTFVFANYSFLSLDFFLWSWFFSFLGTKKSYSFLLLILWLYSDLFADIRAHLCQSVSTFTHNALRELYFEDLNEWIYFWLPCLWLKKPCFLTISFDYTDYSQVFFSSSYYFVLKLLDGHVYVHVCIFTSFVWISYSHSGPVQIKCMYNLGLNNFLEKKKK